MNTASIDRGTVSAFHDATNSSDSYIGNYMYNANDNTKLTTNTTTSAPSEYAC